MKVQVEKVAFKDVEALRELYRHDAHCQIVRDSGLARGFADPYLVLLEGRLVGYGAVWTKHDVGRLREFYLFPQWRGEAFHLFRELLAVSGATSIEAQTNMPFMLTMLHDCAEEIEEEAILFRDVQTTSLTCSQGTFRKATPEDAPNIFTHHDEPVGDCVIESRGEIVATGGALYHYNPPYGDIFMEVEETARRQGFGSYLVQEIKRLCYERGKVPAARCNPTNLASRMTLQRAGLEPCGRILSGKVKSAP